MRLSQLRAGDLFFLVADERSKDVICDRAGKIVVTLLMNNGHPISSVGADDLCVCVRTFAGSAVLFLTQSGVGEIRLCFVPDPHGRLTAVLPFGYAAAPCARGSLP